MSGPSLLAWENLVGGWQPPAAGVLDRDAGVDQLKSELGGASEKCLDMLGVVDTGQLYQDSVLSLALNRRLLGPCLVDPPANDLD